MPSLSIFQNNKEFDLRNYCFNAHRDQLVQFEWAVSQFITNDFCDGLLIPAIKNPQYGNFNNYQLNYIKKQCMSESFEEPDIWKCIVNMGKGSKAAKY